MYITLFLFTENRKAEKKTACFFFNFYPSKSSLDRCGRDFVYLVYYYYMFLSKITTTTTGQFQSGAFLFQLDWGGGGGGGPLFDENGFSLSKGSTKERERERERSTYPLPLNRLKSAGFQLKFLIYKKIK